MCWETLRVICSFSQTFILKCFYPVFVANIGSWGRRLPHGHDWLRLLTSVDRVWSRGPRAARAGRVSPLRSRTQVVRSPDRRGSAMEHSWIAFRIWSWLTIRSFNPYLFSFDPIAPGGGVHTGRHGDRRRGGAHTRTSLRRLGRPPRSRRLAALIDRQGVCHWARLQIGHRCCPGADDVLFGAYTIGCLKCFICISLDRFLEGWGIALIRPSKFSFEIPKFSRYLSITYGYISYTRTDAKSNIR